MPEATLDDGAAVFVEQAEYLEDGEFKAWTETHPDEKQILQKLSRGGAKLITGPRGCGKTTLLLKAYRKLLQKTAAAFPVYVNFKSSLRLEPLYKSQANAMYWFNQWMLLKCYVGLFDTLKALNAPPPSELRFSRQEAARAAETLELGADLPRMSNQPALSIDELQEDIDLILNETSRLRCIFLFDDAAHAFSPEQQRDFFDFFRRIKSTRVAPKAAIYPGVTIVSPSFHIGHDAEEIDVWLDPFSSDYIPFMKGLLKKRLPRDIFEELERSEHILELVCFAAFGMPRALLNMVREFYEQDSRNEATVTFNIRSALNSIRNSYENTVGIYSSLRHKLPMYRNFIDTGEELIEEMLSALKRYNHNKPVNRQSLSIAIQTPLKTELQRVLGFLEYAGLVMPENRKISRGVKGRFELFHPHAAGIIDRNAILAKRSVRTGAVTEAMKSRHPHEFTRITPEKLLNVTELTDKLELALPPCQNCGTPRASESAKFCLNCGSPLTGFSTFKTLVDRDISDLPLSDTRVKRIKEHSRIKTIGDVLMDHEHRELRGVPWIGPYWADRIYRYAEEFIA